MHEMIIGHHHLIQNILRDGFFAINVKIDNIGTNALQRSLQRQLLQISPDKTVRITRNLENVHIRISLHILHFNLKNLMPSILIRDGNFKLAIEPSRPPQRRLNDIGTIRGSNHNNIRIGLQRIHQRQQLRYDPLLRLPLRLITLWRNRIQLIHENNRRSILLRLLERLPQIRLALPALPRHDLRSVDNHHVRASLLHEGVGDECLAAAGWAVE
mmetsp:Transcript_3108/g.6848  ORF Transcript_3108/g.6848 Transcript_3108/m.6848 type:complete len:214 (-) Transcript_3108:1261-1902(-)